MEMFLQGRRQEAQCHAKVVKCHTNRGTIAQTIASKGQLVSSQISLKHFHTILSYYHL